MTASTVTLTPEVNTSGAGAIAETRTPVLQEQLDRARKGNSHGDYQRWQHHVASAAACVHPIRLAGDLHTVNVQTGEIIATQSTKDMPDGVLYKPCGNRRVAVCPSCAEKYRADAYQLIKAGISGGKGISDQVRTHPAVFATFTAPSFGAVHTHRLNRKTGKVSPCRWRATADICPHGRDLRCPIRHGKGEPLVGSPLCLDCYDYSAHVVWHVFASSELWRRTIQEANRFLRRILATKNIKISYAKVAEYQARAAIHYHAILRLDGHNPDDPTQILPPPTAATIALLQEAVNYAVRHTCYLTPSHPSNKDGWLVRWGEQLLQRPIVTGLQADHDITAEQVAGYIAKYSTKSTETTGHISGRITSETLDLYADSEGSHAERLIDAAWNLGDVPPLGLPGEQKTSPYQVLRRAAHQYGYGGHFLTKSRKYSATFRFLRQQRQIWKRARVTHRNENTSESTGEETLIVGSLHFAASGWKTNGDAELANTAAALAREWRQIAKEEMTTMD